MADKGDPTWIDPEIKPSSPKVGRGNKAPATLDKSVGGGSAPQPSIPGLESSAQFAELLSKLPEESNRLFQKDEFVVHAAEVRKSIELANKEEEAKHKRDEKSKENTARIRRENNEHEHELWEKQLNLIASNVVIVLMVAFCLLVLYNSTDSETRGWARNILNTLVTGFLAYSVGRRQSKGKSSKS